MGPFRSTKGASKQRRDLINSEISLIRTLLPLSESALQRLSQLQVMSLACSYIRKCRHFCLDSPLPAPSADGQEPGLDGSESNLLPFDFHKALMGFLVIVSREGRLLYISDNVTQHLGHSMADLMTQSESLYELVDKGDHSMVKTALLTGTTDTGGLSLLVRMNISRSRAKQTGASRDSKIVSMRGHFIRPVAGICGEGKEGGEEPVFTAICSPLIITETSDALADDHPTAFKSVHKLDMSFIDINKRGEGHLGYKSVELRRVSWYQLIHPEDSQQACETHRRAIQSEQETGCTLVARLLSKAGRWMWLASVLFVRQSAVDAQETVIVCCHQVIDEEEAKQLRALLAKSSIALSPPPPPASRDPFQPLHQLPDGEQGGRSADYSPSGTEDTGDGYSPVTIEGTFSIWDANYGPLPPLSGFFSTSPSSVAGYSHHLPPSYTAAVAPTDTWKTGSGTQMQQQQRQGPGQGAHSLASTTSTTANKSNMKRKASPRGSQSKRASGAYHQGGYGGGITAEIDIDEENVDCGQGLAYPASGKVSGGGGGVMLAVAPNLIPGHQAIGGLGPKSKKHMQQSSVAAYTACSPYTYPPTPEMYVNDVMLGSPALQVDTLHATSDSLVPQASLIPVASPVEPEGCPGHTAATLTLTATVHSGCSSEEWLAEIVNYLKAEEGDAGASITPPPEYESAVIGANWIDAFVNTTAVENGWRSLVDSVVDPSVLLGENL